MFRRLLIALAAVALSLTAFVGATAGAPVQMFVTPLNGGEEVPPRATHAHGAAIFQLSPDGSQLSYRLIASNINNVFMAHIHRQVFGVNGPIVVWLFPSTTPDAPGPFGSGRHDGVLATGTITAGDLTGPMTGLPLSDLVVLLRNGGAYVNAHTNDGVAPTNTGAGDFPGSEIRGQID